MATNCYSKCVEHKVDFKWTITDFQTCRQVCMADSSIQLFSKNFSSSYQSSWRLQLIFDDPEWISISLHYARGPGGNDRPEKVIIKARFEVFILGVDKGKTYQSCNEKIYCFSTRSSDQSGRQINVMTNIKRAFIATSTMNKLLKELLDNSLTICCNLTEFENPEFYEPKIHVIPSNITIDLKALYENKANTDFVFLVDKEEFRVHKAILIARSPVFAAMFAHETLEQDENQTTITDINAEAFKLLLEFLYTDNVSDIDKYAIDLLVAANKYHLERLHTICQKNISESLTVNNAAAVMVYANRENAKQLLDVVTNFILNHKKEVAETPGFKELGKTDLDLIIMLFRTNNSI